MFEPMNADSIKEARFIPAATVRKPPSWFRERGVAFIRDQDDLDAYEFVGVLLNDLPVGLLHYENDPHNETTLLFPEGAVLRSCIGAVAREFELSLSEFRVRHPEEMGEPA